MAGAWALHEIVEVARRVLLGLSARVIHRGDQRGVGRSAAILSILFSLLRGGALVLILALGLTFAMASIEACENGACWGCWAKVGGPVPSVLGLWSPLHVPWFGLSHA